MQALDAESRKAGTCMNIKKTKVMMCSKLRGHSINRPGYIDRGGRQLQLLKRISLTNDTAGEVKRRLQHRMGEVW